MSLSPLVSFKSRFVTYLLNFPRSFSLRSSLYVTHMTTRILKRLLNFQKTSQMYETTKRQTPKDSNRHRQIHFLFFMAQQSVVRQGQLVIESSQLYSDTPQSVELLWTSDQPDAETST